MKAVKLFVVFFAVLGLMVGAAMVKAPAASAADLTGTWRCDADTPFGKGNPYLNLKVDAGKVTGTYEGALGEAPLTGTVTGDDFELSFVSSGNKWSYIGKIAADGKTISGKIKVGDAVGTFTGKRF
jgi:hypothetical protein